MAWSQNSTRPFEDVYVKCQHQRISTYDDIRMISLRNLAVESSPASYNALLATGAVISYGISFYKLFPIFWISIFHFWISKIFFGISTFLNIKIHTLI